MLVWLYICRDKYYGMLAVTGAHVFLPHEGGQQGIVSGQGDQEDKHHLEVKTQKFNSFLI